MAESALGVPRHVAIIMDGNGRWARRRGYPRAYGHVRGSTRVKSIVREADRLGIEALTLFAFSTENWTRPESELNVLWTILKKYLKREINELDRNNVRLRIYGELERLNPDVRVVVESAVKRLSKNTGLQLGFAISYGARREISRAARRFAEECAAGLRKPEELTEELLESYLWTAELGRLSDVDLVIRTSGEMRVSNFLLWQAAYAEYVFYDLCWPDFKPEHLRSAMGLYETRERRFGSVGAVL